MFLGLHQLMCRIGITLRCACSRWLILLGSGNVCVAMLSRVCCSRIILQHPAVRASKSTTARVETGFACAQHEGQLQGQIKQPVDKFLLIFHAQFTAVLCPVTLIVRAARMCCTWQVLRMAAPTASTAQHVCMHDSQSLSPNTLSFHMHT